MKNPKLTKVVSIRVSEAVKKSLDNLAHDENISLNELGNQALEEFIAARRGKTRTTEEVLDENGGLAPTPESLSPFERKLLQLQSLNLATLSLYFEALPQQIKEDLKKQDEIQKESSNVSILANLSADVYAEASEVLAMGFTSEYRKALGGLDSEMPSQNGIFVHQVLGMFEHLKTYLSDPHCKLDPTLRQRLLESIVFLGFEPYNPMEAQMATLAAHLVNKGLYETIKADVAPKGFCKVKVHGASHLYRQMLVVYNRAMQDHLLSSTNGELAIPEKALIAIARICDPTQWPEP
ncbi:MAG: YfbU family protein [Corynebacterium sp.]|nr:YfbU family protein [Corynebacterium sp.]